jgi:hypothetical protein
MLECLHVNGVFGKETERCRRYRQTKKYEREIQLAGESATLTFHSSVVGIMGSNEAAIVDTEDFGVSQYLARKFSVYRPEPYAQHPISVGVSWCRPRERKSKYKTIVPNGMEYFTVKAPDGRLLYDSRTDIPVDMDAFAASLLRWRNQWREHFRRAPAA